MFCKNCGKEIPDGTQFCTYCGAPQNGAAVNNTVAQQAAPVKKVAPKQPMDPKKKKNYTIIAIVAVVVCIVIGAGYYFISNMPKKISILSNAAVTFDGYDGYGKAAITFAGYDPSTSYSLTIDKTNNKFFQDYQKLVEKAYSNPYATNNKLDMYNALNSSLDCSWDLDEDQINHLSNGDEITYKCSVNEFVAKQLKYEFTDLEKTFTVEGLAEADVLDLFADVTVNWSFKNGYPQLNVENNSTDPYIQNLYWNYSSVDSQGNVSVYFNTDATNLAADGYVAKDDAFEKTYNVGIKPIEISSLDAADAQQAVKDASWNALNTLVDSCSWQVYKGGNPLDVWDFQFSDFYNSWGTLGGVYNVTTNDGTYTKTVKVSLYRLGDGTIYDATSPLSGGCEVTSSTYSGNKW